MKLPAADTRPYYQVPAPLLLLAVAVAAAAPFWEVVEKGFFLGEDFSHFMYPADRSFSNLFIFIPYVKQLMIRPLADVLWKAEYIAFGTDARLSHAVSVALHCIAACLLFFVARGVSGSRTLGFLAALTFAVFPLHSEPVSWLAANNVLLCAIFIFATLIAFGDYARSGRRSSYLATFLFFVLSLLSLETAIVMPAVLLLYDLLYGKAGLKRRLMAHVPFFLLSGLYVTFRYMVFGGLGGYGGAGMHIMEPLKGPGRDIYTLFVKMPLDFLYPVNREISGDSYAWVLQVSALAVGALLLIRLRDIRKDYRLLIFSAGFMVITFVPYLGMPEITKGLFNSRFLYLPSAGFCIFLAWLLDGAVRKRDGLVSRRRLAAACILVGAFYGILLYNNNLAYVGASERMKAVYSDLESLRDHSSKDVFVLIIDQPTLYKGARFIQYGYWAVEVLLSGPDKKVLFLPVGRAGHATPADETKAPVTELAGLSPGPEIDMTRPGTARKYARLVPVLAGRSTPKQQNINVALVRWDEGSMHLSVVYKTF